MIARHHPSFYSLPCTLFSRPSISLYLLWPDHCLPLSPLHLPLQTPVSSRDLLLSGERVRGGGAAGEGVRGQRECCIWNAKRNRAWGVGVGRGRREQTVMCCSQPYTRPSCSMRVEPVGIQFIHHQIRFVAAAAENGKSEPFDICDVQSVSRGLCAASHSAHGCEMVMSPPA